MLRKTVITCCTFVAIGAITIDHACADYLVRVNRDCPQRGEVEYQLPPNNGRPRTLALVGVRRGLESQIGDVRGDGHPLVQTDNGRWTVPTDCRTVTWTIRFANAADAPIQAAQQQCIYFPKNPWWLISEPTGLLRIEGTKRPSVVRFAPKSMTQVGAIANMPTGWQLPAFGDAPEFYGIGHVSPTSVDIDGFLVSYIADNEQRVAQLHLQGRHEAALRYLLTLFPQLNTVSRRQKRLMVVWIGVEAKSGFIGGAAGSRSFIANYVFGNSARQDDFSAASLMVVAHEQFHQLVALCDTPDASLPTWIGESLAQYYGLKAITHAGFQTPTVARFRARFVDAHRHVKNGLAQLSREFEQGDRSVYPLFYSQGSTFWFEIDNGIAKASHGAKSLDDVLPVLMRTPFDEKHRFPRAWRTPLHAVLGDRLDTLTRRYVGD